MKTVTMVKNVYGDINNSDIVNADVVIVYGDVRGDIKNTTDVIVINGDIYGDIVNCDTVAGMLAGKGTSGDEYILLRRFKNVFNSKR